MISKKSLLCVGVLAVFGVVGTVGCGSPPPPENPGAPTDPTKATPPTGDKDTDGDGVPDGADKCPDKKEDGLGDNPKDGCPNTK